MQQLKLKPRPARKESNVPKRRFYCPDIHTVLEIAKRVIREACIAEWVAHTFPISNKLVNYWNVISFFM